MTRVQAAWVIALMLIIGSVIYIYMQVEERPTDPRYYHGVNQAVLEKHAAIFKAYLAQHQAWPKDMKALRQFSKTMEDEALHLGWSSAAASGGGVYRYRPPETYPASGGTVIMASAKALDEVPATAELPALDGGYMVLVSDLTVKLLSEDEHRQQAGFALPATKEP